MATARLLLCFIVLLLPRNHASLLESCRSEDTLDGPRGYIVASELLSQSINFLSDPCKDFYNFTCNNWIIRHPVSLEQPSISNHEIISLQVYSKMKELLESKSNWQPKSIEALKTVYRKCMDMDAMNLIGGRILIESIRKCGVWPMLEEDKWKDSQFDLTTLLINVFKSRGVTVFTKHYTAIDENDTSRKLFTFIPKSLPIRYFQPYLDTRKPNIVLEAYKQSLISTITSLREEADITKNEMKTEKDVADTIAFETKLAEIHAATAAEEITNGRLSDLQKLMPVVDWSRYFHSTTPFAMHDYLDNDPEIRLPKDYISKINKLLELSDPKIIANHVFLDYVGSWSGQLGQRYAKIEEDYFRRSSQPKPYGSRLAYCLDSTRQLMRFASGALYVRQIFDKESVNVTIDMINDMKNSFREIILESDWIDEPMKKKVLKKLSYMEKLVGYPEFIVDDRKLDEYHSELQIEESDSYGEIIGKLIVWNTHNIYVQLLNPIIRTEQFGVNPADVNGFYSPDLNCIVLPAGILQPPYFHTTFPKAINYAALGSVIAHEITHGFDNKGRLRDQVGRKRDWWDDDVEESFIKRAQCFVDQYSQILVDASLRVHIDGKKTLAENIADNGAVKQAFRAYKNYLKKFGEEQRLEGLEEFNNEQTFFLGYAMSFCSNFHTHALLHHVHHDIHSPAKARVNQVLANEPEFARVFKCGKGTPMNPMKRCSLW